MFSDEVKKILSPLPRTVESWRDIPCIEGPFKDRGQGYPYGWHENRIVVASRFVYQMWHGEAPKHFCRHHCDNPKCINPHHLFDGTQKQNMQDAVSKGRISVKGASHRVKLAKSDPAKIFELRAQGLFQYQIAEMFNLSQSFVSRVLNKHRRQYKEIA